MIKDEEVQKDKENSDFWRFSSILLVALLALRLFVFGPFLVYGSSMEPTFETGDYLIVDEFTYRLENPKRGDVIVLTPPLAEKQKTHFIKRIVGLPGETVIVQGNLVTIKNNENPNGVTLVEPYVKFQSTRETTVTLASDEYFVMGDNREVSSDSRIWGPLKRSAITGRAFMRLYPFDQIGIFPGASSTTKN
ncbi:MAG: signal peptidase I [Patescibacteria group bacterium]